MELSEPPQKGKKPAPGLPRGELERLSTWVRKGDRPAAAERCLALADAPGAGPEVWIRLAHFCQRHALWEPYETLMVRLAKVLPGSRATILARLGQTLDARGYPRGLGYLEQAAEQAQGSEEVQAALAAALLRRAEDPGAEPAEVVAAARRILSLRVSAGVHGRALAAAAAKDPVKAFGALREASQDRSSWSEPPPGLAPVALARARALARAGRRQEALADLEWAASRVDEPVLWEEMAALWEEAGRPEVAIRLRQDVLRRRPERYANLEALVFLLARMGRWKDLADLGAAFWAQVADRNPWEREACRPAAACVAAAWARAGRGPQAAQMLEKLRLPWRELATPVGELIRSGGEDEKVLQAVATGLGLPEAVLRGAAGLAAGPAG